MASEARNSSWARMHRSQTLDTALRAGCGGLTEDVARACPAALGAGNANRTNRDSSAGNRFLMRRSLSSLQGFTFVYGLFTWDEPPGRYHIRSETSIGSAVL